MKQEDLIPGEEYELVYSDCFCHYMDKKGSHYTFRNGRYVFVGVINLTGLNSPRNIFYSLDSGSTYVMFTTGDLSYIIDPRKELVKNFIEDNNLTKESLIKLLEEI